MVTAISWPLIHINSTRESWNIELIWDGVDKWLIPAYLIVYLAIAFYYLYTQRYGGAESREDHKRQEEQHTEILEQVKKTRDENKATNESLDAIRAQLVYINESTQGKIVQQFTTSIWCDIEKLRFKTAYEHLENIRKIVNQYCPNNNNVLSSLEFCEGHALKFIDTVKAVEKFRKAHTLIADGLVPLEIREGYLFALCFDGKFEEAISYADKHSDQLHYSAWRHIPSFLKSEDKHNFIIDNTEINKITAEEILFESIILLQHHKLELDLSLYKIGIDENLELNYHTFQKWVLQLSCALSAYVNNMWLPFNGTKLATDKSELLFRLSENIANQDTFSNVEKILPDFELYHCLTGYLHDRESHWIQRLQDKFNDFHSKDLAYQSLAFCLFNSGKKDDAVALLESYRQRPIELTWNLIILLISSGQWAKIKELLLEIIDTGETTIEGTISYHVVNLVRCFPEIYGVIARNFHLKDAANNILFHKMIDYFCGDESALSYLIENEKSAPTHIKTLYPFIYSKSGNIKLAIERVAPYVPDNIIDATSILFVNLLEKDGQKVRLLNFLRKLRENGIHDIQFLNIELGLQQDAHNHEQIVNICDILYEMLPNNGSLACMRIIAYYNANEELSDFDDTFNVANNGQYGLSYIRCISLILVSMGKGELALNYLYDHIKNSDNQKAHDLYFELCSSIPTLTELLHRHIEAAAEGDYIEYSDGKQSHNTRISKGGRISQFVGKKIGDTIHIDQGVKTISLTLTNIESKYLGLYRKVASEINNHQSTNFKVFDFNDIKDDIIGGLKTIVAAQRGIDETAYSCTLKNSLAEYMQGKTPLYLAKPLNGFHDIYDLIFGKFTIYQTPTYLIKQRFENGSPLSNQNIVLDLTSLILLHSISRKFSLIFKEKFLISQRVFDYIREFKNSEDRGGSTQNLSHLSWSNLQHIVGNQELSQCKFRDILDDLLRWVNANCKVIVVNEMIEHISADCTPIVETYLETLLLAQQPNNVLMTEDYWLCHNYTDSTRINVEFYVKCIFPDKSSDLSAYLTELNYCGHDVDGNFIVEQILLKERDQTNEYERCRDMVKQNPYILTSFILASQKLLNGLLTTTRISCIDDILYSFFSGMGYKLARWVYPQLLSFPLSKDYETIVINSFKRFIEGQIILPSSPDIILNCHERM